LIDEQSEGQEGDLVHCPLQQIRGVVGRWHGGQQSDLLQVFGGNGERDGVADGFVEAVIGSAL